MRLLLDYRPALAHRTGVGEYAHELAVALLRQSGPDDALELFTSSWKDRPSQAAREALSGARWHDHRIPVRVLNWAWHHLEWPPAEAFWGPADVAVSFTPLLLPSRARLRLTTVHDLDFLRHPDQTRGEIRRDYARLAGDHTRRASLVLVNSECTAREVRDLLGVPPERILLCQPGVPGWARSLPARPVPADGYVLFIGTLEPRKNLGTLLDAWERLLTAPRGRPLPRLRVAGAATSQSAEWLDRISKPPLAAHVDVVGYVRDADRPGLYRGARLLVVPSHHEGFGLPVLEAMAAGVPVVASRAGALPEVLGEAGVLVEPGDPAALAAAITSVVDDDDRAAACAERGRRRARAFDWDRSAAQLMARCRQLAGSEADAHRH